jgi:cytochrome c peroxidase
MVERTLTCLGIAAIVFVASALVAAGCAQRLDAKGSDPTDRWSEEELAVMASLQITQLAPPPADPSNRFEKLPATADLGKRLFFDRRFSRNQAVSCATCHDPGNQFQDGRPLAQGVGMTARRTMPVPGVGYSPWLFWDGRKDSLWAQALGPLEDPREHGGNRLHYAHLVQAHYRSEYEAIFGAMPDLAGLPEEAGPMGSASEKAAWEAMDEDARQSVSRVFANMGKAIAAYQKTLNYGPSRVDRYVDGVLNGDQEALRVLSPQEKNGLRIFIGKGQCVTCHNGPLLTDQHFHNTGVPPRDPVSADRGRAAAVAKVQQDEFNCVGRYSDAKPELCEELRFMVTDDARLEGAFKTPGLRNVALRPPYMYAGQIASLADVVRHYMLAPQAAVGHNERKPLRLSEPELQDLVDFLGSLSGPIVEAQPKT